MICENCGKARVCKYKEECEQLEKEQVKITGKPYGLTMSCNERISNYNTGGVSTGWGHSQTIRTPYDVTVTASPETIENVSKNVIENLKNVGSKACGKL